MSVPVYVSGKVVSVEASPRSGERSHPGIRGDGTMSPELTAERALDLLTTAAVRALASDDVLDALEANPVWPLLWFEAPELPLWMAVLRGRAGPEPIVVEGKVL